MTQGTGAGTNFGTLKVDDGAALQIDGTIDNTGSVSENSVGSNTFIDITPAGATLTGGGTVSLSDNSHNIITGTDVGATLTNVDNTISGSGQILGDTVHGYITLALVNQQLGVIDATGSNALVLNLNSFTNDGLVEATNPNTLAQTGGLAIKSTTVDQTGGGTIKASGSHVDLQSAIILGGTLATANGGVIDTVDNGSVLVGTVSQVNNTGALAVNDGTALALRGTIDNTGSVSENSVGSNTFIDITPAGATLTGGGTVSLSDNSHNIITGTDVGATLTNVDNTISGSGQILGDTVHGYITLALVNQQLGVIDATGSNALVFNLNSFTNDGLVEATNGGTLDVTTAVAGSGTIAIGGGIVDFQSAVNQSVKFSGAGTLELGQSGSFGATVSGFGVGDAIDLQDLHYASSVHVVWT